ncbi:MAG: hypothetical protein PHY99_02970 [Bacteroidales bacterium]|nr:hypothetical protein [Bacteroidales bacterium]
MEIKGITPKQLWAKQQISGCDVDYRLWKEKRSSLMKMSELTQSCLFTVDAFRCRYDFASDRFKDLFGYNPVRIRSIAD